MDDQQKEAPKKTIGELRVRTDFNPDNNTVVDIFKQSTAKLINLLNDMKNDGKSGVDAEKIRLLSLAQTAYEEAAMWSVKAATI